MRSPSRSASASRLRTTVGEALADGDAVGVRVERPAAAVRRERVRLAEAQVGERVLDRVDAAGERPCRWCRVCSSRTPRLDGRERRRAGGVDRVVRPAEVEPVGDPAGGDVHEQAGEGVLGPLRQRLGDAPRVSAGRRLAERATAASSGRCSRPRDRRRRRRRRGSPRCARGRTAGRRSRVAQGGLRGQQRRAAGTARSSRSELGGMPKASGSNGTSSTNPPQRE